MKTVFSAKKVLALLILALATADVTLPVLAMEVTNGEVLEKVNGKYGANLESVVGARVDTDLTNATITNTQTNSVLKWTDLNVAPKQTLDFVMSDGQTSLNTITGMGLSQFAGTIKAEHGRLIISNPNGIIFENGAYVNANALTVTTHQAVMENDKLHLIDNGNNASIIFEGGTWATSRPVFQIAKDLNIVSNNIDMKSTDIIAKDIRLVTADGVTFYAVNDTKNSSNFNAVVNKNNLIDNGNINVNDSIIAVKDKSTGKISIVSRGDITVKGTELGGKTTIDALDRNIVKNNTSEVVASSTTTKEDIFDMGSISNWANFWDRVKCFFTDGVPQRVANGKVFSKSETTTTTTNSEYDLVAGRGNVLFDNVKANDVDIKGSNIKISNSAFNKLDIVSSATKTTSYRKSETTTTVSKKEANEFIIDERDWFGVATKGHFNVDEVTPTTSTSTVVGEAIATATTTNNGSITLDKVTSSNTVKATGDTIAMYNSTVDNFDLAANNVKVQNTIATGNKVSEIKATNKVDVRKSQFKTIRAAAADITFTDTDLNNGNLQATKNVNFTRTDSRKTYSINNSTISADNINANDMNISDSLMVANNDINANKSTISNTEMNAERNVYANGSKISNSVFKANNDIQVANGEVANTTLTATKDLKLGGAKLNNVKAKGRYGFLNNATLENGTDVDLKTVTGNAYSENDTVENLVIRNSKLKSTNNMNLKNTTIENGTLVTNKDVNIDTNSDVHLAGVKIGGDLNVTKARNLVISNSQTEGSQYIPSMTDKKSVTDYDRTKFDSNYFENIIGNYGRDYGNNTNLSDIKGNVNISNTKNSLIINRIIGKDLTTNNVYGVSNLITSLVEGNYNPARIATADVNVYKSFIGGNYEEKFADKATILPIENPNRPIVIDSPTTLPEENPNKPVVNPNPTENQNNGVNQNNDRVSSNYSDDVNKRKFGESINTSFQRRFSPRGFAAQEDEISEMKNSTKASIVKTENKNVKFTKSFYAY